MTTHTPTHNTHPCVFACITKRNVALGLEPKYGAQARHHACPRSSAARTARAHITARVPIAGAPQLPLNTRCTRAAPRSAAVSLLTHTNGFEISSQSDYRIHSFFSQNGLIRTPYVSIPSSSHLANRLLPTCVILYVYYKCLTTCLYFRNRAFRCGVVDSFKFTGKSFPNRWDMCLRQSITTGLMLSLQNPS